MQRRAGCWLLLLVVALALVGRVDSSDFDDDDDSPAPAPSGDLQTSITVEVFALLDLRLSGWVCLLFDYVHEHRSQPALSDAVSVSVLMP